MDEDAAESTEYARSDIAKPTYTLVDAEASSNLLNDRSINVDSNHDVDSGIKQAINTATAESQIRTLDGEIAGDEFAGDAVNYQILLGKIDGLLDKLRLDA